jgi:hypothetical protein
MEFQQRQVGYRLLHQRCHLQCSSRWHSARGKKQLFDFFGGDKGRDQPMRMEWHHLLFDETTQIGAGEYTFTYQIRTHGVAIVRILDGKIANWREYEQVSPLPWSQFIGENHF